MPPESLNSKGTAAILAVAMGLVYLILPGLFELFTQSLTAWGAEEPIDFTRPAPLVAQILGIGLAAFIAWRMAVRILYHIQTPPSSDSLLEGNGQSSSIGAQPDQMQDRSADRIERLDRELKECREFQQVFSENALTGIFVHQDGLFRYMNRKFANIFGYTVEELLNTEFWRVVHPDDQDMVKKAGTARAEGRSVIPRHYTCRCLHKDGRVLWIEVFASSITYENKPSALGYIYDISERKRSESALLQSEEKYRNILENIVEGYYEVDLKGNMTFFNSSMERILGYHGDELTGMNYRDYMDETNAIKVFETFNRVYKTGGSSEAFGWELLRKDGALRHVEVSVSLLRDSNSEPIGFRGICMDVTDRKRQEQLLLQTERYKAVADLAGGVAHNFNNLLQIVMGGTRMAIRNIEKQRIASAQQTLEQILESCMMGSETVERLQAFAGLRTDSGRGRTSVFDLSEIVKQAVDMSKPWWKTKPELDGFQVRLESRLEAGCFIRGKKSELFEVTLNLLKNAAEALPAGGAIEVETQILEGSALLRVRDTGIGISESDLQRIFNPFFSTKMTTGTGMGLSTSRKIVNDHGGQILAGSVQGEGTEFTITLPLVYEAPNMKPDAPAPKLETPLNILTVDDVEQLVLLLHDGLSEPDAHVFTAFSGEAAIDLFRKQSLDVVICDLGMPGMNGWEVATIIKTESEELGIPRPAFILLTGWGNQLDAGDKMETAGVDTIIQKPVDIPTLKDVIYEIAHKRRSLDW